MAEDEKKTTTKLRNVRIDRVDLVDRGANPGAHVEFWKRDIGAEGEAVEINDIEFHDRLDDLVEQGFAKRDFTDLREFIAGFDPEQMDEDTLAVFSDEMDRLNGVLARKTAAFDEVAAMPFMTKVDARVRELRGERTERVEKTSDDEATSTLASVRKSAGKTQEQIAKAVGVEQQFVSMVESGQRRPSFELAKSLAAAYGLTIEQMHEQLYPELMTREGAAKWSHRTPLEETAERWRRESAEGRGE